MALEGDGKSLYRCKVKCLHDWIMIRMVDIDQKVTPGGIILPDTAESQPVAQVVSFGPGLDNPIGRTDGLIEKGDLVLLQKYTGTKVLLDNKTHMLVKFYDLQAVLTFVDDDGNAIKADIPETMFDNSSNDVEGKKPSGIVQPPAGMKV